jgi:hypothetical protein
VRPLENDGPGPGVLDGARADRLVVGAGDGAVEILDASFATSAAEAADAAGTDAGRETPVEATARVARALRRAGRFDPAPGGPSA